MFQGVIRWLVLEQASPVVVRRVVGKQAQQARSTQPRRSGGIARSVLVRLLEAAERETSHGSRLRSTPLRQRIPASRGLLLG